MECLVSSQPFGGEQTFRALQEGDPLGNESPVVARGRPYKVHAGGHGVPTVCSGQDMQNPKESLPDTLLRFLRRHVIWTSAKSQTGDSYV